LTGDQLELPADSSLARAHPDNLPVAPDPSIPRALVLVGLQVPEERPARALDLVSGQDSVVPARVVLVELVLVVPAVLLLPARLRVQAVPHRDADVVDLSNIQRPRKAR
jgi:hypothetical protein